MLFFKKINFYIDLVDSKPYKYFEMITYDLHITKVNNSINIKSPKKLFVFMLLLSLLNANAINYLSSNKDIAIKDFKALIESIQKENIKKIEEKPKNTPIQKITHTKIQLPIYIGAIINNKALINNKWIEVNNIFIINNIYLILKKIEGHNIYLSIISKNIIGKRDYKISLGNENKFIISVIK